MVNSLSVCLSENMLILPSLSMGIFTRSVVISVHCIYHFIFQGHEWETSCLSWSLYLKLFVKSFELLDDISSSRGNFVHFYKELRNTTSASSQVVFIISLWDRCCYDHSLGRWEKWVSKSCLPRIRRWWSQDSNPHQSESRAQALDQGSVNFFP